MGWCRRDLAMGLVCIRRVVEGRLLADNQPATLPACFYSLTDPLTVSPRLRQLEFTVRGLAPKIIDPAFPSLTWSHLVLRFDRLRRRNQATGVEFTQRRLIDHALDRETLAIRRLSEVYSKGEIMLQYYTEPEQRVG